MSEVCRGVVLHLRKRSLRVCSRTHARVRHLRHRLRHLRHRLLPLHQHHRPVQPQTRSTAWTSAE